MKKYKTMQKKAKQFLQFQFVFTKVLLKETF